MPKPPAPTAIHRRLPASVAALPQLRSVVRSFATGRCGADEDQSALIALAVTEAATNVVRHAYPGRPGMIDFQAESNGNELRIRIGDGGVGISSGSPNSGIGAGLQIMQGLAETHIDSQPGRGTEVELVFRVRGCGATQPRASEEPRQHPRR